MLTPLTVAPCVLCPFWELDVVGIGTLVLLEPGIL
jgi:hypothetical protein